MDEAKVKKISLRSLVTTILLAYFVVGGSILFGEIIYLSITNPNPTIIATNARNGAPFYVCANASLSTIPCEWMNVQNTGICTVAFNFTGGNGTVAKVELVKMDGTPVSDLTNGANYTWSGYVGDQFALRVTRLLPDSQSGNLTWADVLHN